MAKKSETPEISEDLTVVNTDSEPELIVKNTAAGNVSQVVATTHKVTKGGDYAVDEAGNLVKTR